MVGAYPSEGSLTPRVEFLISSSKFWPERRCPREGLDGEAASSGWKTQYRNSTKKQAAPRACPENLPISIVSWSYDSGLGGEQQRPCALRKIAPYYTFLYAGANG